MAWPFDSEEQLDEWVDQFIEEHSTPLPDDPAPPETDVDANAQAAPAIGDIDALLSDPDLFALHQGHEEAVWRFILKVLARQAPEQVLGYLAAGLLEDLIAFHGDAFIDRIETQARVDPRVRRTLHGVWRNRTPPGVWARVELARGPMPRPVS